MTKIANIEVVRQQIDNIDLQILDLLNTRAKLSFDIRKEKIQNNISIYDPKREQEILNLILSKNNGPLRNEDLKKIFFNIIKTIREANLD